MDGKHWTTVAMLLTALAAMIAGLDHWSDALRPPFVAGLLTMIATVLKAMFQDAPQSAPASVDLSKLNGGR